VVNRGTVHHDVIADLLTGSAGQDRFLVNTGGDGGGRDRITDLGATEFAVDIDSV
jgi:Ca2+-binding RTX toxin-like protein